MSASTRESKSSKSGPDRGRSSSSDGSTSRGGKKTEQATPVPEPESQRPEYQRLSVVVFKGAPWDSYNKRHCALYVEHYSQLQNPWRLNMIDIEGAERKWSVRESVNRNPEFSQSFAAKIPVKDFLIGAGEAARADRRLRNDIYNAPIDNVDPEFNCQRWLEGALNRLKNVGWLAEHEVNQALDAAFDVILQAPLEPISLPGARGSLQGERG